MRPRLLLVTRDRFSVPLGPSLQRKFDALGEEFELRVLASGSGHGDDRFELAAPARALDGPAFYAALPRRAARTLRAFRPDAVLVQGTHETAAVLAARKVARLDVPVILDLHGDWRAATRLYGSPLRRLLDPVGDALSRAVIRQVDGVRTLSDFTSQLVRELGREPTAVFPAYVDAATFLSAPARLSDRPRVVFIGVLERYKNVEVLAAAWRGVRRALPTAALHVVGRGRQEPLVRRLVAESPHTTAYTPTLSPGEVARALDDAWALVLPSRSEGLPRIVIEAFCRGRGAVGSRAGGIPDVIDHGRNGLLVDNRPGELADALVRVLADRELSERLGARARIDAARWVSTPEQFAQRIRELVDRTGQLVGGLELATSGN